MMKVYFLLLAVSFLNSGNAFATAACTQDLDCYSHEICTAGACTGVGYPRPALVLPVTNVHTATKVVIPGTGK